MHRRLMFAALIVSARLATAAGPPLPDYLPATTNALIGFQVRTMIDSGLFQSLGADAFKTAAAKATASSPLPGLNLLTDLDEVVIATAGEGSHPPTLAICHGRFPVGEFGSKAELYHGVPILHAPDGSVLALFDAGTVVAGQLKDVQGAIDRRQAHGGGVKPELAQRAGELSGQYAVWGVGTMEHGFNPSAGNGKVDGLGSMDRFDFGIGVNHGMQISATVHVRAPEDAQKLAAALQFIQMMAQARPEANGAKIDTHAENGTLSLSVTLSEEALKKAIEQQRVNIAQAVKDGFAKGAGAKAPSGVTITTSPSMTTTITATPQAPVSNETQVVTDKQGNTIEVTLPGARRRF